MLAQEQGPFVVVGHSYGGAVMTNAVTGNPQVKALVYIAGFIPDVGEDVLHLAGEGSLVPTSIEFKGFPPFGETDVDIDMKRDAFRTTFAGDLPRAPAQGNGQQAGGGGADELAARVARLALGGRRRSDRASRLARARPARPARQPTGHHHEKGHTMTVGSVRASSMMSGRPVLTACCRTSARAGVALGPAGDSAPGGEELPALGDERDGDERDGRRANILAHVSAMSGM